MKKEEIKKLIELAKASAKNHLEELEWKVRNKHVLSYTDRVLMNEELKTLLFLEEVEKRFD